MDLKDFVKSTLVQMVEDVAEAQAALESDQYAINPVGRHEST